MALSKGYTRVAFDDLAWEEDLRAARGSAPRIASETRARLEREGQEIDALFACDPEGRDGTSLPDCMKVYLPPPGGPLGLVYRRACTKSHTGGCTWESEARAECLERAVTCPPPPWAPAKVEVGGGEVLRLGTHVCVSVLGASSGGGRPE